MKRPDFMGFWRKRKTANSVSELAVFFGAEGGIRTLERLLTVTRFPIVRTRPTPRLLHRLLKKKLFIFKLVQYKARLGESQGVFCRIQA